MIVSKVDVDVPSVQRVHVKCDSEDDWEVLVRLNTFEFLILMLSNFNVSLIVITFYTKGIHV